MSLTNFIQVFPIHIIQEKKMTYRTCKPPSQSVYSGVYHRLALEISKTHKYVLLIQTHPHQTD